MRRFRFALRVLLGRMQVYPLNASSRLVRSRLMRLYECILNAAGGMLVNSPPVTGESPQVWGQTEKKRVQLVLVGFALGSRRVEWSMARLRAGIGNAADTLKTGGFPARAPGRLKCIRGRVYFHIRRAVSHKVLSFRRSSSMERSFPTTEEAKPH